MHRLGIDATARASFAFYNTHDESEPLGQGLERVVRLFGLREPMGCDRIKNRLVKPFVGQREERAGLQGRLHRQVWEPYVPTGPRS